MRDPVDRRDLIAVQLGPWRALAADLRRAPSWRARLGCLVDAPGYDHEGDDRRVRTLRRATPPAGTMARGRSRRRRAISA